MPRHVLEAIGAVPVGSRREAGAGTGVDTEADTEAGTDTGGEGGASHCTGLGPRLGAAAECVCDSLRLLKEAAGEEGGEEGGRGGAVSPPASVPASVPAPGPLLCCMLGIPSEMSREVMLCYATCMLSCATLCYATCMPSCATLCCAVICYAML
jgi:hypothetical protein